MATTASKCKKKPSTAVATSDNFEPDEPEWAGLMVPVVFSGVVVFFVGSFGHLILETAG
jgi:hypothetical protein